MFEKNHCLKKRAVFETAIEKYGGWTKQNIVSLPNHSVIQ